MTFYPHMSHFKYWIWMKFSSFFHRKKSFFVKNQRFFVVFTIDNRFLALNPLKKVLWTSKHHFWEVHFLWPKWHFTCKKREKNISCFFSSKNCIIHCKNEKKNHNVFFPFFACKMSLIFGHKKWTSQKWCLEVHRTFS